MNAMEHDADALANIFDSFCASNKNYFERSEKLNKIKSFFKKHKKELLGNFKESQQSVECKPIKDFFFFKYDNKVFNFVDVPKKLERGCSVVFDGKIKIDLNEFDVDKLSALGYYRPFLKKGKSYDFYSFIKTDY